MEARQRRNDTVAEVRRDATFPRREPTTLSPSAERWIARGATVVLRDARHEHARRFATALRLHILPSSDRSRSSDPPRRASSHGTARSPREATPPTPYGPTGCRCTSCWPMPCAKTASDDPGGQLLPNERPTTEWGASGSSAMTRCDVCSPRQRHATTHGRRHRIVQRPASRGGSWPRVGATWTSPTAGCRVRAQMGRDGKRQRLKPGAAMRDVISCHSSHTNSSDTGWQAAPRTRATLPSRRGWAPPSARGTSPAAARPRPRGRGH